MSKSDAVAVYHKRVEPKKPSILGLWLPEKLPKDQRQEIKQQLPDSDPGHIGVQVRGNGTVVIYLGRVNSARAAREMTESLSRSVAKITGITAVVRELTDYREVSRALAG